MTKKSAEEIAQAWIEKWDCEGIPSSSIDTSDEDLDYEISRDHPQLCLEAILYVLTKIPASPENRHFQVLAAGPLENLIVESGEQVIDQIDVQARKSPEFRLLLNGSWISDAKPKVLERLKKYLDKPW